MPLHSTLALSVLAQEPSSRGPELDLDGRLPVKNRVVGLLGKPKNIAWMKALGIIFILDKKYHGCIYEATGNRAHLEDCSLKDAEERSS